MILVVNTAEEALQLVLAHDGRILESFEEHCPGRMNEVMAPAVAGMLERHGGGLARVACVRGPGSFTGLRLGLAFATGLCLAKQLPMAGLDYLPLLAATAFAFSETGESGNSDEVHVVTHSRTARVYHQGFVRGGGGLETTCAPLGPPRDFAVQDACDVILSRARSTRVTVLGTGLRRNSEAFTELANVTSLPTENPAPEILLNAALATSYDGPPVDALYLRGSDAEENLAVIAAKRGLSEEEAMTRMEKALR
ncbi:MAG: tRNA (adenosine(37)-N6)-threonylcarbamoyltransferase complex dimerization subunit type 1 TsaB [Desulfovibrio sp.]|nr:tRNA (adenosine(37)-N6)-threonylcarbamoyltransferase complex dimerization subunit type 1 TsaB [Desulfovibrio sp.]MBI4961546.1 tRNA (adenosine(37)-N6)-threonylcarbamoyltransferase complex dimerization subunit type 1 TsaB [Desulfovibrio sp.]